MTENKEQAKQLVASGYEHYEKQEFEKEFQCFQTATEIDSQNAQAWVSLGVLYAKKQEFEKEFQCYQTAIEKDPEYVQAWYNLGIEYARKQEFEKAFECYQTATEIDPEYAQAWVNLGIEYARKQEFDQVLECYQTAIEKDPEYAQAWYNLGGEYARRQAFDQAFQCFQTATDIDPEHVKAWGNLGIEYARRQAFDQAFQCFQTATEIDPEDANAWVNLGVEYVRRQAFDQAFQCYQTATDIDPEHAEAWYNLGIVYGIKQAFDQAFQCFQTATEIDPEHVKAWGNLGIVYGIKQAFFLRLACCYRSYHSTHVRPEYFGEVINGLLSTFHDHYYVPAFIFRILWQEHAELLNHEKFYQQALAALHELEETIALLRFMKSEHCSLSAQEQLLLEGMIYLQYGDPEVASRILEPGAKENLDDLQLQYLYLDALDRFLMTDEHHESGLYQTLETLSVDDLSMTQQYYAGQLWVRKVTSGAINETARKEFLQKALSCFSCAAEKNFSERNEKFLPALFMLVWVYDVLQEKEKQEAAIQQILFEEKVLDAGERKGFLHGVSKFEVALEDQEWHTPLYKFQYSQEIMSGVLKLHIRCDDYYEEHEQVFPGYEWWEEKTNEYGTITKTWWKKHTHQGVESARPGIPDVKPWILTEASKQVLAQAEEQEKRVLEQALEEYIQEIEEFNEKRLSKIIEEQFHHHRAESDKLVKLCEYAYAFQNLSAEAAVSLRTYVYLRQVQQQPKKFADLVSASIGGLTSFAFGAAGLATSATGILPLHPVMGLAAGVTVSVPTQLICRQLLQHYIVSENLNCSYFQFKKSYLEYIQAERARLGEEKFCETYHTPLVIDKRLDHLEIKLEPLNSEDEARALINELKAEPAFSQFYQNVAAWLVECLVKDCESEAVEPLLSEIESMNSLLYQDILEEIQSDGKSNQAL